MPEQMSEQPSPDTVANSDGGSNSDYTLMRLGPGADPQRSDDFAHPHNYSELLGYRRRSSTAEVAERINAAGLPAHVVHREQSPLELDFTCEQLNVTPTSLRVRLDLTWTERDHPVTVIASWDDGTPNTIVTVPPKVTHLLLEHVHNRIVEHRSTNYLPRTIWQKMTRRPPSTHEHISVSTRSTWTPSVSVVCDWLPATISPSA